jgi:hypothetical protein
MPGLPFPSGAGAAAPIEICEDQRYALCASATCFVFNLVAYCKCDVERGDSITESDGFDGGDACSINEAGVGNGYMVSTYSLPESVTEAEAALYTCRASTSDGAYAQCDGGICFTSTRGQTFPGFEPLEEDEVICSCPITVADPRKDQIGYQFLGPYPCQEELFDYCRHTTANTNTGSYIPVGAPTGTPRFLTRELQGSVPPLKHCIAPAP